MTDRIGVRGVLMGRLALLGERRDGEAAGIEEQREALRLRIAKLGQEVEAEQRLPYRDDVE